MLPATYRGHERVAQVVLAVRGLFDVGPLEVAAPAAGNKLLVGENGARLNSGLERIKNRTYRLPSFRTPATRSMVSYSRDLRWLLVWNNQRQLHRLDAADLSG